MLKRKYSRASSRIARRGKTRRIFSLFIKIGMPVAVIIGIIFFLRADFLQIKNFEVVGAEIISPEDIKNSASRFIFGSKFFLIPKSNILLLNKDKLTTVLLSDFGRLQEVSINKKFLSKIVELKVLERKTEFLWCSSQDECYHMAKDGLIFAPFDKNLAAVEQVIFKGNLGGSPLMRNFATLKEMENYAQLIKTLANAGLAVTLVEIESQDRAVAKTSVGEVIFGPEESDLSIVAQNVILLIEKIKSKDSAAKFQYIDARFGNKIFYKLY